ncbi:MAG: hypothetical protein EAY75_12005 [Bacteroidetes bacterium]|nr:MAG: hypothetical protein EAY75_12005 [Bacteroidota bacterium]
MDNPISGKLVGKGTTVIWHKLYFEKKLRNLLAWRGAPIFFKCNKNHFCGPSTIPRGVHSNP